MKEIIRKIDVFSGLDDKLLHKLAETAITCTYPRDEVIVREGEVGIGMYFILRGRVAIVRKKAGADVRVAEIGANHFVAEMALVDDKPRSASVVTVDETECLLFTRDTFLRLMEKHPKLAIRLARVLAERLRTAQAHQAVPAASAGENVPTPVQIADANNSAAATSGMKATVQRKLLDMFEMLYTVKAFTRFSVAVLGCPVEGYGTDVLDVIRVGDVKAVVLPGFRPVELGIEAYGAGQFQLHVFQPDSPAAGTTHAQRFEPVLIEAQDRFTLSLPDAVLTRRGGGA